MVVLRMTPDQTHVDGDTMAEGEVQEVWYIWPLGQEVQNGTEGGAAGDGASCKC